ncbi:MAG: hypothetical protein ACYCYP_12055, partial [Leptospirales bacterium]
MAMFDQRGDLQWRAQIRRKGFPVQRKAFNSRAGDEALAAVVESEIARGVFVSRTESESTTLKDALGRYENGTLPTKKKVRHPSDRRSGSLQTALGGILLRQSLRLSFQNIAMNGVKRLGPNPSITTS